jgi:single-strand DNA-binding protein
MNGLNQIFLIGRLGKDPDCKEIVNGMKVCNFTLAVPYQKKGEEEQPEWFSCVAFDKLAEVMEKFLQKGSEVFVSGRVRTRKWQDNDGNTRYATEVVCDRLQMLGKAGDKPASAGRATGTKPKPVQNTKEAVDQFDDDIPF